MQSTPLGLEVLYRESRLHEPLEGHDREFVGLIDDLMRQDLRDARSLNELGLHHRAWLLGRTGAS